MRISRLRLGIRGLAAHIHVDRLRGRFPLGELQ